MARRALQECRGGGGALQTGPAVLQCCTLPATLTAGFPLLQLHTTYCRPDILGQLTNCRTTISLANQITVFTQLTLIKCVLASPANHFTIFSGAFPSGGLPTGAKEQLCEAPRDSNK